MWKFDMAQDKSTAMRDKFEDFKSTHKWDDGENSHFLPLTLDLRGLKTFNLCRSHLKKDIELRIEGLVYL